MNQQVENKISEVVQKYNWIEQAEIRNDIYRCVELQENASIEKACEWLKENIDDFDIEKFKTYMKK